MNLEKAGLYIAENLTTGENYLISVTGKLPMLRVDNVLSIDDFAAKKSFNVSKESIENNCENFLWYPLQSKISITHTKEQINLNLSKYQSFERNRIKYTDLLMQDKDNEIIIDVCKNEDIDMDTAKELLKQFKLNIMS